MCSCAAMLDDKRRADNEMKELDQSRLRVVIIIKLREHQKLRCFSSLGNLTFPSGQSFLMSSQRNIMHTTCL